ncbi:MAG TPA: extracellular matrix/biofilm biosynthesis regulator RemA family protein [Acidobacteriota bacterium]
MKLLRIGFGNAVVPSRLKQIQAVKASDRRHWRKNVGHMIKMIDATAGRQTRSMLIMDSGHIILSSMTPESLEQRLHELLQTKKE